MTPKEKAIELYEKYRDVSISFVDSIEGTCDIRINNEDAKECALIAVDEIIGQWEIIDIYLANGNGQLNQNLEYWYKVKQEIYKL